MATRKKAPETMPMFDIPATEREPRATRVKENWRPTPDQMAKCRKDFPTVDLDEELEKFRDHHMAKGSKFVDHYRALRTWLRNARDWQNKDHRHRASSRARPQKDGLTPPQPFPVYNPAERLGKEPF